MEYMESGYMERYIEYMYGVSGERVHEEVQPESKTLPLNVCLQANANVLHFETARECGQVNLGLI